MVKKRISDMLRQEVQKSPDITLEAMIVADEVGEEVTESLVKLELPQVSSQEGLLQQQVLDLQTSLDEQKKLVQKLQKELDKTAFMKTELADMKKVMELNNLLKTELEDTKKAALQLADANSQLIQEIKDLTIEKEATKADRLKNPGWSFSRFPEQNTDKPDDFAANSWLL